MINAKHIIVSFLLGTVITWTTAVTFQADSKINVVTKNDIAGDAAVFEVLEARGDASLMKVMGNGNVLASPSYGSFYVTGSPTLVLEADSTYYQFTSFTADGCSGDITCSVASDNFTVNTPGVYIISISTLATYTSNDHNVHPNVYLNGNEASTSCHQGAVSSKTASVSGTLVCPLTLAAGDVLDLRFEDATAGGKPGTLTFTSLTFSIFRIN